MNDQRQVIFSQRLRILKENDINEIIKDFFEEIIVNLNNVRANFQKSGDEKSYLAETKNIIGNIINDDDLLKIGKLKETEFREYLKNIFKKKILE